MLLIARDGVSAARILSIRVSVTAEAGSASAFFEMKSRPPVVPAHSVLLSLEAREIHESVPPVDAPSGSQSPHWTVKSPVIVCGQTTFEPEVSNVPLSCVPPWTFFAFAGFTDRLWNCSVCRPLFRLVYAPGTADSSCLQRLRLGSVRPRPSQRDEMSTSVPSDRIRPPSEPSQNCSGLLGLTTSRCWSGCTPLWLESSPVASSVRSVNVSPPSCERSTARAFERP